MLATVRVPRYVNTTAATQCSLYGFCDVSQRGYAVVVFLRIHDAPRASPVMLVGSNSKLAPLKPLSIPRLELNTAVLLSRWMSRIFLLLNTCIDMLTIHVCLDGFVDCIVMVNSAPRHVQTICVEPCSPSCQWHHVSSETNPADCAPRGLMPSELPHNKKGPAFLHDPPQEWSSDIARLHEV